MTDKKKPGKSFSTPDNFRTFATEKYLRFFVAVAILLQGINHTHLYIIWNYKEK